ncbi:membrane protein insertion efficiency factor YidD [Ferrovum myxofaciens]|uniref:Putative membrane protein insertion efficiency factor n=1 Tax=Ferrovum myxofaciens TaxID=416213 RepID=A0A9E6MUU3_9PROT|nr:membrane protein insertion efficiency factor YidD [Ferrovum myxofaciens]MBU6994940.1 membrane protein insertion efficiency factor YidD [Ferrovum myxofaciens]QKE38747.1 MAG: membrane protein insertion efficiency factor YidD [Ferrovum myxofaciens]QKE41311.1 MAG: membrane protein insertion efficiency factor YidD [Ferrovum myxofaciens]QWY73952.1 MAG: membrane protein insertion efficiency factor YidD [Ferrovum myxofaciens]QWY76705.1 MAG: membrane protein insertion efficiency factor YidD [Ferrovu
MSRFLQFLIRSYQLCLSPFLGRSCRFYPTCSQYAHDAILRHGSVHGIGLAAKRLCKCHPWNPGGYDPVP